jgi:putative transposase
VADGLRMALDEVVRKALEGGDADFLREGVRALAEGLMELEVSQHLGAGGHERTPERTGHRNGYRERQWDTRVGTVELRVPRVRDGDFFPSLLEPRRRAERALTAVVQEAYVQGVSTRRVDDLVKALGMSGISKSQVSRLRAELDAEVERFRTRKLTGSYPYLWLDATFVKVRQERRVVGQAVVVAIAVTDAGEREVLGLDVGPSEDGQFWLRFLRGLVARGLRGVRPVTSDSHEGLKGAIAAVLHGASWQRCRVHSIRTQSQARRRTGRVGVLSARRRRAERDDVADLERVVADHDALDQQLQDGLPLVEADRVEPTPHAVAERGQVREHRLGAVAVAA